MKVAENIINRLNRLQEGYVFTYIDFNLSVDKSEAVIKALNRMVETGKIRKLSKGRYYKPKITEFGELKPDVYQVVKDLLEKDGKIKGYLTGYSAYNELGLTTQVPNTIQIGVNNIKRTMKRGLYKIKFIKQPNRITKENIPLFRLLDAVRYIKEIPDTSTNDACKRLILLVKKMKDVEIEQLKKLTLKYTASTRALTGAILENVCSNESVTSIYKSLNPTTKFKFTISNEILPNKQKWNIV